MQRHYSDWLKAYLEYSSYAEAPDHMRFWSGVSAIAGALQRKCWIEQGYFRWYPNFYIIMVAPPGVVQKTTTAGIAMNLLRKVPGVKWGPDVVTWQSLVKTFAEAKVMFEATPGQWHAQCAMTMESGEFGNLLDPQDRPMVDLFVSLWDGKQGSFRKETKGSGNDEVENPWINMIACTTPSWIAGSFPEYMIGGGFTSRCIFVYAEKKTKLVPYPILERPVDIELMEARLVTDLTLISKMTGEFKMSAGAYEWGKAWYKHHFENPAPELNNERFGGYIARKQTHIHKLAMIFCAALGDSMIITEEHLGLAERMVTDLEPAMAMVFSKVGRSELSFHAEKLMEAVKNFGPISLTEAYFKVHSFFPNVKAFDDCLSGLTKSGQIALAQAGTDFFLTMKKR